MRSVAPAHEREALSGVEQAVERGVAEQPGARSSQAGAGGGAVETVHHAAVRDERDRLAGVPSGDLRNRCDNARVKNLERFAATRRRKSKVAGAPASAVLRPAPLDLGPGVAFEGTEAALAQARLELQRQTGARADGLRGFAGARQVAGVEVAETVLRQGLGDALGLPAALGVERNVELALNAGVDVPRGLAVAHRHDARGLRVRRHQLARPCSRALSV